MAVYKLGVCIGLPYWPEFSHDSQHPDRRKEMQIKIEKVDTSGPLQKAMVERSKKIKAGKIKADASWSFETIVQGLDQADARAAAQEAERQAIAEARKRRKKSRRVKKLIKLKRVFRKLESRLSQLESDNRELRERLDRISNVSRGY